jgi:uncharacterized cupin superfamily protein
MVPEAKLVPTETGFVPEGEGWYVLNARESQWHRTDDMGTFCTFEGDVRFTELGIGFHVLWPGQPNGLYHAEEAQEDVLVLSGECLLLVEGQERPLGPWDFVHCPPGTEHIFVGAGSGPCVLIMAGSRRPGRPIVYPVNELAQRHRAGVDHETTSAQEAYAPYARPRPGPAPDVLR